MTNSERNKNKTLHNDVTFVETNKKILEVFMLFILPL